MLSPCLVLAVFKVKRCWSCHCDMHPVHECNTAWEIHFKNLTWDLKIVEVLLVTE
jgi:hypothetical protein